MQTSVNLQNLYSYSPTPLFLLIIVMVLLTAYVYTQKDKKKTEPVKEETKKIPEKNIKNIPVIKNKYLSDLKTIEERFLSGKYNLRKAYQEISEKVRMFVFEVTDIQTQNYSLEEIKKLTIPGLYDLIEEFYEPEFALKSEADFTQSLNKARSIIEKWN